MHEMSIAMNIVEISEEEVEKAGGKSISKIELEIGSLSGVVIDALEFALQEAVKNTVLEQAERNIRMIQAQASCLKCGNQFEVDDLFTICPSCNSFETEITRGKEMKIKSLVVA